MEEDGADAEHRQGDSTDDIRPGLGWEGLMHLQQFVSDGGVLITVDDSADFVSQFGLAPGVSTTPSQRLKVVGAILKSKLVDGASPIAYGYGDDSRSTPTTAHLRRQRQRRRTRSAARHRRHDASRDRPRNA